MIGAQIFDRGPSVSWNDNMTFSPEELCLLQKTCSQKDKGLTEKIRQSA